MLIRVAASSSALAAASIDAFKIAGISVQGPFLAFDFTGADSLLDRLDVVANWEACAAQLIAEADDANDINALTAFKRAIADVTRDVSRESYMQGAVAATGQDATSDQTGSHPTQTGVASTSLSSQHGADDEQKEEIENEQEQQEQPPQQARRRRR
jgi:hypothetical protein